MLAVPGSAYSRSIVGPDAPTLRLARAEEAAAIDALMKASTRDLFPLYYDETRTVSSIAHVAHVDRTLLGSLLSLDQSFILVWPQVVALTVACCGVAYVRFMRQEVRA